MKRTSDIASSAELNRQRRCLARWLREWALDRLLRSEGKPDDAAGSPSSTTGRPLRCAAPGEPGSPSSCLRVGQVRLLHPVAGTPAGQRPVYIALLEERPAGHFLVAPFGRFSAPALPGEWRTGLRALPLRVLCLWNGRIVAANALRASWRAGRLKPEAVARALEVLRHVREGAPLATVSPADIGSAVLHPLDPRLEYQAEEANVLEESLFGNAAAPEDNVRVRTVVYDQEPDAWLLAAESGTPYHGSTKPKRKRSGRRGEGR